MIPISAVLLIIGLHWVGDFLLQNDWMALGKSKRAMPLLVHVVVYSSCFLYFFGPYFCLVTLAAHLWVDLITSRVNARLWKRALDYRTPSLHWFFVSVGFDQLLHMVQLVVTYKLLHP